MSAMNKLLMHMTSLNLECALLLGLTKGVYREGLGPWLDLNLGFVSPLISISMCMTWLAVYAISSLIHSSIYDSI